MKNNPEFARNLWLEFTPHRLVAVPAIVAALVFLGVLCSRRRLRQDPGALGGVRLRRSSASGAPGSPPAQSPTRPRTAPGTGSGCPR